MKKRVKLIIFILAFAAAAAVLFIFFVSPMCVIETVDTENAYGCTEEEELFIKESFEKKNAFFAMGLGKKYVKELEKKLKAENPYIETIEISYVFPDKMTAVSSARERSFLAEYYGMYLCLDTKGVLLETFSKDTAPELPVISGLDISSCKTGSSVFDGKNEKADNAIRLCSMLKSYGFYEENISIIDMSDSSCVWIYFAPYLTVKLGPAEDLDLKVSKLKGILDKGFDGESEGTVDFTVGNNPVFKKSEKSEEIQSEDG